MIIKIKKKIEPLAQSEVLTALGRFPSPPAEKHHHSISRAWFLQTLGEQSSSWGSAQRLLFPTVWEFFKGSQASSTEEKLLSLLFFKPSSSFHKGVGHCAPALMPHTILQNKIWLTCVLKRPKRRQEHLEHYVLGLHVQMRQWTLGRKKVATDQGCHHTEMVGKKSIKR